MARHSKRERNSTKGLLGLLLELFAMLAVVLLGLARCLVFECQTAFDSLPPRFIVWALPCWFVSELRVE